MDRNLSMWIIVVIALIVSFGVFVTFQHFPDREADRWEAHKEVIETVTKTETPDKLKSDAVAALTPLPRKYEDCPEFMIIRNLETKKEFYAIDGSSLTETESVPAEKICDWFGSHSNVRILAVAYCEQPIKQLILMMQGEKRVSLAESDVTAKENKD